MDAASRLGKLALKAGAGALGGYLGGPAGAAFGSSLFGSGDYTVNENSVISGAAVPVFRDGKRSVIIKHREYLTDILSSTGFTVRSYSINPGLVATFPWLSGVASNFEQYKFHGLVFEFKSTAGSAIASTNNALGAVIMATEYNAEKPAFASKQAMEAYEFSASSKPSETFLHPIECAESDVPYKLLYTRVGSVDDDLRLYDMGNFQIATQGMQAASVSIGELWVTYEVELLKPLLPVGNYTGLASRLSNGPYDATNYLGLLQPSWKGSFQPVVSATGAGYDTITLPASILTGIFFLSVRWQGASTAITAPTIAVTNGSVLSYYNLDSASSAQSTGTTIACLQNRYFSVSNLGGTTPCVITFSGGTLPSTPAYVDVLIVQCPSPFT